MRDADREMFKNSEALHEAVTAVRQTALDRAITAKPDDHDTRLAGCLTAKACEDLYLELTGVIYSTERKTG